MQAVGKVEIGIKLVPTQFDYQLVAVFPYKENARNFLIDFIKKIKGQQEIGQRSKRNLDPNYYGGLDFLISPIKLEIPEDQMKKRGWKV